MGNKRKQTKERREEQRRNKKHSIYFYLLNMQQNGLKKYPHLLGNHYYFRQLVICKAAARTYVE